MNESLTIKIKSEIKKELIDYYDKIRSNIDIKAQTILINHEIESKEILDESLYLIQQVNRVCDDNLANINQHFDDMNRKQKFLYKDEYSDELSIKEEIKKMALKSYIILIDHVEYPRFGLHLEFDWYINQSQIKIIRLILIIFVFIILCLIF